MSGRHPWSEIRDKMSPERRLRLDTRVRGELTKMDNYRTPKQKRDEANAPWDDTNDEGSDGSNSVWAEGAPEEAMEYQVGGQHYKHKKFQPIEYILGNNLDFCEGCVVKYVSRWREKGGIDDLKKAKHYLEFLIEEHENRQKET